MKLLSILSALSLFLTVHGHGYIASPRSRNWVAAEDGLDWAGDWGTKTEAPPREHCPYCLNNNDGVCGTSNRQSYDRWLDMNGDPMPWVSQGTFGQGEVVHVQVTITSHHYGHMELKACPDGRASTQACFDTNPLIFVHDTLYGMPADPRYPERGYLADPTQHKFEMGFQLPENLAGTEVLLQVTIRHVGLVALFQCDILLTLCSRCFAPCSESTLQATVASHPDTSSTSKEATRSLDALITCLDQQES
jgi:hypothetical protein